MKEKNLKRVKKRLVFGPRRYNEGVSQVHNFNDYEDNHENEVEESVFKGIAYKLIPVPVFLLVVLIAVNMYNGQPTNVTASTAEPSYGDLVYKPGDKIKHITESTEEKTKSSSKKVEVASKPSETKENKTPVKDNTEEKSTPSTSKEEPKVDITEPTTEYVTEYFTDDYNDEGEYYEDEGGYYEDNNYVSNANYENNNSNNTGSSSKPSQPSQPSQPNKPKYTAQELIDYDVLEIGNNTAELGYMATNPDKLETVPYGAVVRWSHDSRMILADMYHPVSSDIKSSGPGSTFRIQGKTYTVFDTITARLSDINASDSPSLNYMLRNDFTYSIQTCLESSSDPMVKVILAN